MILFNHFKPDALKVLITGAAGFIGSSLADHLLEEGHTIVGIDNFDAFYPRGIKENNIKNALNHPHYSFIEGDIRDAAALEKCFLKADIDVVIHLAAKPGVRPSIENPVDFFDVNVNGTVNVLEMMRKYKKDKLLFASSSSVYGNNEKIPFSETDPVDNPISPYAATKKSGELLCHTYHHLFGFNIYCLRFFTVYGPRQRPDLAIHKFTNLMMENKPIPVFGDGQTQRDYTYIKDIIQGICKAMEHIRGFEIINLGESRPISLLSLIHAIEKASSLKANINWLPMQPGDVNITYADVSKAKGLFAYNPNTSIDEGLMHFWKWKKDLKV